MLEHSLESLWEDAVSDRKAINLSSTIEMSYIYKGIKIVKVVDDIKIYNTRKLGIAYKEISQEEYDVFLQHGFRNGVHQVLKNTYKEQIEKINYKIQGEVNTRNNKKHYESLKVKRENLINKYSNLNN
tara:strand:- start:4542 stop:4925 length:384 start_codon:yes stop_codon:yes gene_type:complete